MKISLFLFAAASVQHASGVVPGEDRAQPKQGLRAGRTLAHHMSMGGWHSAATANSKTHGSQSASAKSEKKHDPVDAKAEKYSKAKSAKSHDGHSTDYDYDVSGKSAKSHYHYGKSEGMGPEAAKEHTDHSADETASAKGTDVSAHSDSAHSDSAHSDSAQSTSTDEDYYYYSADANSEKYSKVAKAKSTKSAYHDMSVHSKAAKLFKSKSAKKESGKHGKSESEDNTEPDPELGTQVSAATSETMHSTSTKSYKTSAKGGKDHSVSMEAKSSKATHHSRSHHSAPVHSASAHAEDHMSMEASASAGGDYYYHTVDAKSSKVSAKGEKYSKSWNHDDMSMSHSASAKATKMFKTKSTKTKSEKYSKSEHFEASTQMTGTTGTRYSESAKSYKTSAKSEKDHSLSTHSEDHAMSTSVKSNATHHSASTHSASAHSASTHSASAHSSSAKAEKYSKSWKSHDMSVDHSAKGKDRPRHDTS